MVTERSSAAGTLTQCFFISTSEGLFWHFLRFREYDIKGLEKEFYLLMTQFPAASLDYTYLKNDASHLHLRSSLPQQSMERQGPPGNEWFCPLGGARERWCDERWWQSQGGDDATAHSLQRVEGWGGGCPRQGAVQTAVNELSCGAGLRVQSWPLSNQQRASTVWSQTIPCWNRQRRNLDLGSWHRLCNRLSLVFPRLLSNCSSDHGHQVQSF